MILKSEQHNPHNHLRSKTNKGATNAEVRQDKETPRRFNTASEQSSNVQGVAFQHKTDEKPPAFQRPKHHGSQKRQVVPVPDVSPALLPISLSV